MVELRSELMYNIISVTMRPVYVNSLYDDVFVPALLQQALIIHFNPSESGLTWLGLGWAIVGQLDDRRAQR